MKKTITLIPVRYGGGSYKVKVEGGNDGWVGLHGKTVFDYEADAIAVDAKKDGYKIVKIDAHNAYIDYDKLLREMFNN
jgi:hypothetical protein